MSSENTQMIRPGNGAYDQAGAAIERQGFGSREMERRNETQAVASAELAKAQIQARYIVAMQRPRDVDDFRVRMLKHAKRPGFAALAEYAKPVGGGKVRGMSIRFVEAALQEYGNVIPEVVSVYDDDEKRIIRVSLTDLERNVSYVEDATVEKYVERSDPRGGEVIGERRNSSGKVTYRVRATEDDYANKLAAKQSKVIRNLGLRILPPDIVDEVRAACTVTRNAESAKDPDADRKKLIDAFAGLRVMPSDLAKYLGHDVGTSSPAEIDDLRAIYAGISTGETTWTAIMAERAGGTDTAKPADAAASKLKEKLAKATKPAAKVEWKLVDGRHTADVNGLALTVEQSGPDEWGWWVYRGDDEIASNVAKTIDIAKTAAERAAA